MRHGVVHEVVAAPEGDGRAGSLEPLEVREARRAVGVDLPTTARKIAECNQKKSASRERRFKLLGIVQSRWSETIEEMLQLRKVNVATAQGM